MSGKAATALVKAQCNLETAMKEMYWRAVDWRG